MPYHNPITDVDPIMVTDIDLIFLLAAEPELEPQLLELLRKVEDVEKMASTFFNAHATQHDRETALQVLRCISSTAFTEMHSKIKDAADKLLWVEDRIHPDDPSGVGD